LTYKDTRSPLIFYVESDGRHIAAIAQDGKVIWHRDPFIEAKLPPYRKKQARIVWIGKPQEWMVKAKAGNGNGQFISISYDSTQFGVIDTKSGDFTFLGQD
jgi:hypothetical protein